MLSAGLRSTKTRAPNVGLHIGPNDGFTSATLRDRFGWDLSRSRSSQFLGRFVAGNWGISLHIPVFGYDPLTNHLAKSSDVEVVLNGKFMEMDDEKWRNLPIDMTLCLAKRCWKAVGVLWAAFKSTSFFI